jgi:hypothetical protein
MSTPEVSNWLKRRPGRIDQARDSRAGVRYHNSGVCHSHNREHANVLFVFFKSSNTGSTVAALVTTTRYPFLSCEWVGLPLAVVQHRVPVNTGTALPLRPVPPTAALLAGSGPSWRCTP